MNDNTARGHGDVLHRALHAEVEYAWPARDGLDRIDDRVTHPTPAVLLARFVAFVLSPIPFLR